MKIGVISDVHANACALAAALDVLDGERVSQVVMLGDLLSYGAHVQETMERVRRLTVETATTFLVGNHDVLYFELQRGQHGYFATLPAWIQESARWTLAALGETRLDALRPWVD
ncbi:MAG: metallophosphoesterase, partial [Tepidisphaeraceae bacterium]